MNKGDLVAVKHSYYSISELQFTSFVLVAETFVAATKMPVLFFDFKPESRHSCVAVTLAWLIARYPLIFCIYFFDFELAM